MLILTLLLITGICPLYAEEEEKESSKESSEEATNLIEPAAPNIILILADDLGWNDVSFHGSPQIPTPNIDALASSSIILNNYYTEPLCTPSRAALLSGQYPIHLGLQHSNIKSGEPTALPLNVTILPEYLQKKGYVTHMVGKWHLGYAKKDYTPLSRGFNSFFGFYNEMIDYYDYTNLERQNDQKSSVFYGVDLQDGLETVKNFRGRYATDVFGQKAVDIIENHNVTDPLFLYISHLACHAGNEYMPLQAPVETVARNSHIKDLKRKLFAGVVTSLDDSVGKLVDALNRTGMLQNSIIVFTTDNGGDASGDGVGKASNFPLRGEKKNAWEGGIRVPCFIWSPLLGLKEPRTSKQLMHVTDWLPTLYTAAGGDISDLGTIDGYNMWKVLINYSPSPRLEILHNIDPIWNMAALRRGDYKLIKGSAPGGGDLWYGSSGLEDMDPPSSMDDWVFKNNSIVKKILEEVNLWLPSVPDLWRINATIQCQITPPSDNGGCDPATSPCLFNVAADPCEYNNLAQRYPRIVRSMTAILNRYNASAMTPLSTVSDLRADPRCHGFAYVPWMDEPFSLDYCPYA
ncbi:arylsulfatase B-like [Uloborus diversus]|uniref:arylsulfatase B-like n=1 Tax=Uloborus diversus TaxID=327109 RepID=UPI00240A539A|nr:arylsulfatase B-like [Uloborus diversus]XP_054721642.1 arylsulfatase B-like [Uloborus diversus]